MVTLKQGGLGVGLALAASFSLVFACSSEVKIISSGENGDGGRDPDSSLDAGADGDPFAACNGIEFSADGVYDVDLGAVHVQGRVTVDGNTPSSSSAKGSIGFVSTLAGATPSAAGGVPIAATGEYQTTLAPGTYDVVYSPNASACSSATTALEWPCNAHVLKKAISITADGNLDFDLATVVVQGSVKLQGQSFPTAPFVTFAEVAGAGAAATGAVLVPVNGQSYRSRIFAGTYDIGYAPRSTSCTTAAPCNSGVVRAGIAITASGVLDVDVPMIKVSGAVSLDGTVMTGARRGGSLVFSSTNASAPAASAGTGITIEANGSYALALLPGTYRIVYSGVPSASAASPLPRGPGLLRDSVSLTSSGVLDFDVPSVHVQGNVTVNGKAAPSEGGAIAFTSKNGSAATEILSNGSYETILVAGTYDVRFATEASSFCPEGEVYPCNSGKVFADRALNQGSGVLDIDLKVVTVQGKVTLNGKSLPRDAMLTFAPPGSKPAVASEDELAPIEYGLAEVTDGTYATRLLAGSYDVGYAGTSCSEDDIEMPCNGGAILSAVSLTSNGVVDADIPSVLVNGKVTLGKQPAVNDSVDRGALSFVGKTASATSTPRFGDTGPITYATHLLRGRYIVSYAPASCTADSKSAFPCNGFVIAGCD